MYSTITAKKLNKISVRNSRVVDDSKSFSVSVSVAICTLSFVLLTCPSTIAGGYYLGTLLSSESGLTILFICDCLAFSYHSFNFFVFLIFNKKFSKEFILLIKCQKKNRIETTNFTTDHSNSLNNLRTKPTTAVLAKY